jgi:hypothetical protein
VASVSGAMNHITTLPLTFTIKTQTKRFSHYPSGT